MPSKVSHSPPPQSSPGTVPTQIADRAAYAARIRRLRTLRVSLRYNKDAIRGYVAYLRSLPADETHPFTLCMLREARRHRAMLLKELRVLVRAIGAAVTRAFPP